LKNISFENFNEKANTYAQSRASYSNNYINIFCEQLLEQPDAYVADIAAGTGINTKQIAKYCKKIYAVEPNREMINECKKYCKDLSHIEYIEGTSDNTSLADNSINIITIAQAFQLLNMEKTKKECQRILKKGGKVIFVWNSKELKNDFFYETEKILLKYCPLYSRKIHVLDFSADSFGDFFEETPEFYKFKDDGSHFLTKKEFIGRALCASYSISKSNANYNNYVNELDSLFDCYAVNGLVYAPLSTVIYIGKV
jgi:ubiquinone/menaquinone biosynthesis C-methylase UbiE